MLVFISDENAFVHVERGRLHSGGDVLCLCTMYIPTIALRLCRPAVLTEAHLLRVHLALGVRHAVRQPVPRAPALRLVLRSLRRPENSCAIEVRSEGWEKGCKDEEGRVGRAVEEAW